jgi:predicted transcriptional regulator
LDDDKRLADLRWELDSNAPNVSAKAKDLEALNFITRDNGYYQLTPIGQAVRYKLIDSMNLFATLIQFKDYWKGRKLEAIPEPMLWDLGNFVDSELVKNGPNDPAAVKNCLVSQLQAAKNRVRAVISTSYSGYFDELERLACSGKDVEVVVTRNLVDELKKRSFKLFCVKENGAEVTLSPDFVALGLEPRYTNIPDSLLVSKNPRAVNWGRELFEYYKSRSVPV